MPRGQVSAEHVGLRDAASELGVSVDTLRRRIKDELLPEAELVAGQFGDTWVVPRESLEIIAKREGWSVAPASGSPSTHAQHANNGGVVLDLRESETHGSPSTASSLKSAPPPPSSADAVAADQSEPPAGAQGEADLNVPNAVPSPAHPLPIGPQPAPDLPQSALLDALLSELAAVREAVTTAEVRAASAETRVELLDSDLERQRAAARRAETDVEYWRSQHDRTVSERESEQAQRIQSEKRLAVSEAQTQELRDQAGRLEARISDFVEQQDNDRTELAQMTEAMGWWSRRRLNKIAER